MNLYKHIVALGALTVITALPAAAQVEKVAMKTTGISCGTCAAVSEIYLRRLAGIDTIKISLSSEAIMVSYKPGAAFQPKDIRDALKKTEVGVTQFQISARGRVQEQGGKRFFVAGGGKVVLQAVSNAPPVPSHTPVFFEGKINYRAHPHGIERINAKPTKPQSPQKNE